MTYEPGKARKRCGWATFFYSDWRVQLSTLLSPQPCSQPAPAGLREPGRVLSIRYRSHRSSMLTTFPLRSSQYQYAQMLNAEVFWARAAILWIDPVTFPRASDASALTSATTVQSFENYLLPDPDVLRFDHLIEMNMRRRAFRSGNEHIVINNRQWQMIDSPASNFNTPRIEFNADKAMFQFSGDCPGRTGPEERIEHNIAWIARREE